MKLGGETLRVNKPFRHQHVLTDEHKIGDHDRDWSKQHLHSGFSMNNDISSKSGLLDHGTSHPGQWPNRQEMH